ncbi:MAG: acyl-CoA dehydrogenase family protein [Planctomycetia bacterium]|nr:acyl-CoA dehydrogenase family protein [Planctomycetia bacterium]
MGSPNRDQQLADAEAILGDRLDKIGFAKGLYFGHYLHDRLVAYPDIHASPEVERLVEEVRRFCIEKIDAIEIDRREDIPPEVIAGLGKLGVLGACMPKQHGGLALTQTQYCRVLEVLGGHCGSTALFVNAHHSIGPRAIVLFGTREQQERWLPKLATGEAISAFALTEPEAGSDAANVQTRAENTPDGKGYVLNGEKRYITNGCLAKVLTVMARTPVPGKPGTHVTAFLVTPDMPGFEVTEARMPKCGVRGTATSRLAFHEMFVPRENVLGQLGRGLRVALTVLDFGRTTFGACCTGAAKFCLGRAVEHANRRVQFGETLGSFELVKEKLAYMGAATFAMEAATYQTAALIDSGSDDYMIETAMLKVFSTESLWRIINDTIQVHGGMAYFNDQPFERMMRDARINMIGEGANDVLRVFIALMGMRDVGLELEGIVRALGNPIGNIFKLGSFFGQRVGAMLLDPEVPVRTSELEEDGGRLSRLIGKFRSAVEALLRKHRKGIVDRQYLLGRIADAAIELYVSSCVIARLEFSLADRHGSDAQKLQDLKSGRHYLITAARRIRRALSDLWDNDDATTTQLANALLRGPAAPGSDGRHAGTV